MSRFWHRQKLQETINELHHLIAAALLEIQIFLLRPFTLTGKRSSHFPRRFAAPALWPAVHESGPPRRRGSPIIDSYVRGHSSGCLSTGCLGELRLLVDRMTFYTIAKRP